MTSLSLEQNISNRLDAGTATMVDDPVILNCNQTLKLETAVEILNNTDQYKVINSLPENPKGGDTFLIIPLQPGDEGIKVFVFFASGSFYGAPKLGIIVKFCFSVIVSGFEQLINLIPVVVLENFYF